MRDSKKSHNELPPQSNGRVERFHRQLKAAIMAHESPNPWTITLPSVLLGVRSAVKELLGRSAAEMIYGSLRHRRHTYKLGQLLR